MRRAWPIAIGLTIAACSGSLDTFDPAVSDLPGQPAPNPSVVGMTPAPLDCSKVDPGPSPLQLLSRAQYLNTLRDLLGDAGDVTGVLDVVPLPSAFGLQQPDVSQVELEGFQKAAEKIAAKAPVPACSADPRTCARDFLGTFGAKAYRAPITDQADIERHLALYDVGAKTSHEQGMKLLLRGILQSPRFLYRVELGNGDKLSDQAVRLSDYELAARLSYVFWKTLPDDTLRDAAAKGQLHTKPQLLAQLDRMLASERGKTALRGFLEEWVHLASLDGLVKEDPNWEAAPLRDQARAFFDSVLAEQDGTLSALLTSSRARSDGHGAGLLSVPALLALQAKPDESSPIYRGKFVREALLCMQLPAPPANIPKPPEVQAGVSTRERLRQHEVDASCSGCHRLLDPIGFGLEHFDALGNWRDKDGDRPVDATGELFNTEDIDGKFDGAAALAATLASSTQVQECMAKQWFRFALARFEQPVDTCAVDALTKAFGAAQGSLHALPHALVESDAFLYRHPLETSP